MSKKKVDYTGYSPEELQAELLKSQADYQKKQFEHVSVGLENPLTLTEARKNIARIKTEARNRELTVMTPEKLAKRSKIRARRRKNK